MTQGITLPSFNWVLGAANPSAFMLAGGDFGDGFVYLSPNGIDWAGVANIGYPGANDACGWGESFVIVGQGGPTWAAATYTDDNWDTWADGDLDITVLWEGVTATPTGSIVLAVGAFDGFGGVAKSADGGVTWTAFDPVFGAGVYPGKVTWNGTVFMACCYNGTIWTSPDGDTWTERFSDPLMVFYDIKARLTDGLAVAVGQYDGGPGVFYTADNGDTWAQADEPVGFTNQVMRVGVNDAVFVVTQDGGVEYATSPDGSAWSAAVVAPDNPSEHAFYDDAECSRGDLVIRATKFGDYALLVDTGAVAASNAPFFHFSFGG